MNESKWIDVVSDIREELRGNLDREVIDKLHKKKPLRQFLTLLRQMIFLFVPAVLLVYYHNPLIVITCVVILGFTVFNFTIMVHEQLHNLIFKKKHTLLNTFLGHIYAFLGGISKSQFTKWHLEHHLYSGVPHYNLSCLQKILTPLYKKHNLEPYSYGELFYKYIILNRKPHSKPETSLRMVKFPGI